MNLKQFLFRHILIIKKKLAYNIDFMMFIQIKTKQTNHKYFRPNLEKLAGQPRISESQKTKRAT